MTSEQTPLLRGIADLPHPSSSSEVSNLTKFRTAIGINIDLTGIQDIEAARKRASGLYKQVVTIQRNKKRAFLAVEWLYYLAIVAQILIGATLASLGSVSKIHGTAITILGVINTSTAGILALLKGQGLPDRLRKDEYQMRKVQDFIEETDTRLSVMPPKTFSEEELDGVVAQIFEQYNAARDTSEMNRPSSYAHQLAQTVERRVTGHGREEAHDGNGKGGRLDPDANGKGKARFVID